MHMILQAAHLSAGEEGGAPWGRKREAAPSFPGRLRPVHAMPLAAAGPFRKRE